MRGVFYITTPIFYVNSNPHIGHAYTTIVTDVFRRYHKLFEEDTYFLTGTDEHGQKIAESAELAGIKPQEFVDRIASKFQEMLPHLHVEHDQFIRTTDPVHQRTVQAILQKIHDQGEIYLKEYEGLYCVGCERFLDESELNEEGHCPDHHRQPQQHREQNYFFRMSAYQDWLIRRLKDDEKIVFPSRYRNELLRFLDQPLQDLCISRPKSRLKWGIDLPFDDNYVTYVWFDALLNYVSALGWPEDSRFRRYWEHCHHIIGKDILKTHGIYWPCILKAAGLPVFKKIVVHGHWVVGGSKMSKSLGNVVNPLEIKDRISVDGLRYFLLREMSFREDANFTEELALSRYHGELANNLGNLINRSISISRNNFEGCVPPRGSVTEYETELYNELALGTRSMMDWIRQFQPHRALERITTMSTAINKYLDENKPWLLAKDPTQRNRLGTVLYTALDSSAWLVNLLEPVMPEKMALAREQLGLSGSAIFYVSLKPGLLEPGTILQKPQPLFPRIKAVGEKVKDQQLQETKITEKPSVSIDKVKSEIGIETFQQLDLRTGKILECWHVKNSDKLLVSRVDLGESMPRSIVSGVAKFYKPEELVGRSVIVVANLKSVKLRGEISEGMILATDDGKRIRIVEPSLDTLPGTVVR